MKNINIKAVTQITGINENTLRAWERRYNILEPKRDENGRRLYSKEEIDKLTQLWKLVQAGHSIGNIAHLSVRELKKMIDTLGTSPVEDSQQELTSLEQEHLRKILTHLKNFDLENFQYALRAVRFELSIKSIVYNLFLPLLYEVGQLVSDSKLSISQEHLLSSLLRDHLGEIYQSLTPSAYKKLPHSQKIILTTREGDLHEFAILIAAILCRTYNHETYYLGPNMPAEDLAAACKNFEVNSVILGMESLPRGKEVISAHEYLTKVDKLAPKNIEILCGGRASPYFEKIESRRKFFKFASLQELEAFLANPS